MATKTQTQSTPRLARSGQLHGLPIVTHAVLTEGMFVIAPSSPKVFMVSAEKRRWVPDPTTLLALAPAGWSSVVAVSDAVMGTLPEGAALPSRVDGHVYIGAGAPAVYVVESLSRHHIPDPDTLNAQFGGWAAVVTIDPADLDAIPAGADIPSVDQSDGTVDGYLRSLPDLYVDPPAEHHDPAGSSTQSIDDVTYDITEGHASLTTQLSDPWTLSPVLDVLFPGSVIQGASLAGGQLAPVAGGLKRAGGTITVATDINPQGPPPSSASASVADVTEATIEDARQQLLRQLNPADGSAYVDWEMHQARTTEHGLVKLGVAFSAGSFSGDLKSSLETNVQQTSVMAMFRQIFYSVTFTPPDGPDSFFDSSVTVDQVKAVSGPANPPVYVSQVDYGRILIVSITGTTSLSDLNVAMSAAVNGAAKTGPGGRVDVSASLQQTLSESTVRVMAVGGNGKLAVSTLSDPLGQLSQYINAGGALTINNPGAPLRYVVRHCGSRRVMSINESTDYDEAIAAAGRNVNGATFQIWDGPGGGPKSTGITVANQDHLTVTATGQNWSGVIFTGPYGPDGWTTWAKPSGSDFPLPNNHPFALAGAWDGAQTGQGNTNDWFYIGSGMSATIDHAQGFSSRVLYLGTNDDNPLNGSAKDKFTVTVSVSRRALANVGPAMI